MSASAPPAPTYAVPNNSNTPVIVVATAAPSNQVVYISESNVQSEDTRVGICRRCRREFRRPEGVNDGQAQYYRCAECEQQRLGDLFRGSCTLC